MVEFTEYKGNKIMVLKNKENDKFPFQFGLGKARMIVANYDAIKAFVDASETKEVKA
jgi:hypothetical protein